MYDWDYMAKISYHNDFHNIDGICFVFPYKCHEK